MATLRLGESRTSKKAEAYRDFVTIKIEESVHGELFNGIEAGQTRENIIGHVADVLFRLKRGYGEPGPMTFDDVLLLAMAVEQRRIKQKGEFKPIFSYLNVTAELAHTVANRLVEYELSFLLNTNFKKDNPDEVRKILLYELIGGNQGKISLNGKSFIPRDTTCTRRLTAIHNEDRLALAVFTWSSRVETSLGAGSRAKTVYPAL
ncbi:hypothetical protein COZ14_00365 [Candidatus Dojkabacteria bacterium CG_4_10_14_3_um_filter_Dojkabacteria_WS6_41_9]|nr:MAG: hypothetical protein COZ14_00365 [Candidatus Dojkabacteria bacterium CG_4_10_14_3_um_filter_Dojkabacteria_WS6_41_9]